MRYYFDTQTLLKYYQEDKGSVQIRQLVTTADHPVLLSPLTILGYVEVVMQYYREGLLEKKYVTQIFQRLRKDVTTHMQTRPFRRIPLPTGIFRLSENLLLQYASTIRLSAQEALHIAIVSKLPFAPTLVTSDHTVYQVCQQQQVLCYDPETV